MSIDEARRRVLLICQLDGFANSRRPVAMQRYLESRGHEVIMANTYFASRLSPERGTLGNKLPAPSARRLALYAIEAVSKLLVRRWQPTRRRFSYAVLRADQLVRRGLLRRTLPLDEVDLVLCATPYDVLVLRDVDEAHTLYDCQTPWADELWFEGRATERQRRRLRDQETEVFRSVDHVTFCWESYARYVEEQYGQPLPNFLNLNTGCDVATERARFATPPRIAYLGSLSSEFIDLPLLSRLSAQYPHIDVFGSPPPDPALGLNYRGYASPDVLREYQFGLITCTKDALRRDGFSAKHIEYISWGLPVLVPAWRRGLDLIRGSVPYDEDTFLAVLDELSDATAWQRAADQAYDQAQALAWDRVLQPLDDLLRELPPRPVRAPDTAPSNVR